MTTLHSVATTKQHLVNWTVSSIMPAKRQQRQNKMVRENKGEEMREERERGKRERDREGERERQVLTIKLASYKQGMYMNLCVQGRIAKREVGKE